LLVQTLLLLLLLRRLLALQRRSLGWWRLLLRWWRLQEMAAAQSMVWAGVVQVQQEAGGGKRREVQCLAQKLCG
jgi:hypothetical protein